MKQINLEELKQIQLEILSFVDKFCQEKGIHYSISGGTAIGAIRHKGYIPWDDDIDIMMKRDDYKKFVSSFKDTRGIYKLHSLGNDQKYSLPFAKVEDTRTLLNEKSTMETIGINIDIFPSDYLGDTLEQCGIAVQRVSKERFKLKCKLILPGKKNSLIKKLGICFFKVLFLSLKKRSIALKIQKLAKSFSMNGPKKYSGVVVWGYGMKEIVPSTIFDTYLRVSFENGDFSIVKDFDTYLSSVYGDYMQLPPIEKRQSPHTLNSVFWKD